MATITIELTETQYKCLEYAAVSPQDWSENALYNRARRSKDDIIALLVEHCNENNIQIATGEDAQITQAFDLEVVKTAAVQEAEFQASLEADAE